MLHKQLQILLKQMEKNRKFQQRKRKSKMELNWNYGTEKIQ